MNKFKYRALTEDGVEQRGEIQAVSADAAVAELKNRALYPLDLHQLKDPFVIESLWQRNGKVPAEDLVIFTRQLATMLGAGMTLLNSIITLEEQQAHPNFKRILREVSTDIEGGKSLTEGLRQHPIVFNGLYVAMIQAGEASGNLENALAQLAKQVETDLRTRRKIKSAMKYPKVVGGAAVVICSGLLIFVVPQFASIFTNLAKDAAADGKKVSGQLPLPTRIVLAGSHLIYPPQYHGLTLMLQVIARVTAAIALFFLAKFLWGKWVATDKGRHIWDGFKLRAPMKIGPIVQKIAVARFARTFATLSSSGVPILVTFDIIGQTAGNVWVEDAVSEAKESLRAGSTIASPLAEANIFPPMVTKMIAVGEESGSLDEMLSKVADFYEEEVEIAIDGITAVIEPIMILIVGAMIGTIVIAIYMPLFSVYNLVG